jgi:hypothetical protein
MENKALEAEPNSCQLLWNHELIEKNSIDIRGD